MAASRRSSSDQDARRPVVALPDSYRHHAGETTHPTHTRATSSIPIPQTPPRRERRSCDTDRRFQGRLSTSPMNSSPLRHTVTAGQAEFKDPIYFSRSVPTSPRNRLGRHRNSPYGSISQGSVPNFEPIQEDIPSSPPHFGPNNVLEVPKLNYSCHDLSTQSPPSLMAAQLSISKKRQRVDSYQDSCLTSSSSHRGSGDTSDQTMNSKETDDTAGAGAGARYPDDPAAEVRYNYTSRWSTDSEDGRICGRGCNAQSKIRKRIVSWARKRLSSTGVLRDSSNNTKS